MSNKFNFINQYYKSAIVYVSKELNTDLKTAYDLVVQSLKHYNIKDPIVKYKQKLDNGDMEVQECSLTQYLNNILNNNNVLAPSFTSYTHPSKMKSIHSIFMAHNTKERSKFKKLACKLKQDGNTNGYMFNNTMQKRKKIANNSLSGAYSSKSTILRNPSAHYTLTSITRCLSGVGNAFTESIVAGNKHFRNYDITLEYILAVITNVNKKNVELCIDKFNLHIPTPNEVLDMILKSTKWYWYDKNLHNKLLELLTKLTDVERVSVMYVNDLWNMKEYNQELIRNMIDNITIKVEHGVNDVSIVKDIPLNLEILTKLICSNEIKGMNINYEELKDTPLGITLLSTMANVYQEFKKYDILFNTFFYTKIMPPGIAYIKEMFRKSIVLSDTDSTCGSYDMWTQWYKDPNKQIPVMGVIMTIVGNVIEYNLKEFSKNMNVPNENLNVLSMKNEFYWPVFINTLVNKHYMALINIQEGNVYKEPDLEIKGVHLIASATDQVVAKEVKNIMKDILYKIADNKKVSVMEVINKIVELEKDIIRRIREGDISVFRKDIIKDPKAYKLEQHLSPYFYHLMWKEVFADKYGSTDNANYIVIKIPTKLDSKKKTNEWIETIADEDIKEKMINFLKKYDKTTLGTFRPPLLVCNSKGIPIEFLNVIDEKRIILDNLLSGYMILQSLGIHLKSNSTLLDMGY